jgi:hypothetical protein
MAFHTAKYNTYVALGDPNASPLWSWKVWRQFVPAIDPLIQAARGKPAVRSTQCLPAQAGVVKFGRLGWKEADFHKWCHGSPTNKVASRSWSFLEVEVWAPAWTACEKDDLAPDLFLSVSNESLGGGYGEDLMFNPVVVVAVVSKLAARQPSEVLALVSALRTLIAARVVAFKGRPWGKAWGTDGFTDSIQDLAASGLFKPGPRHQGEPGIHLLSGRWEPVLP